MRLLGHIASFFTTGLLLLSIGFLDFILTDARWVEFDQEIRDGKRIESFIDMNSINHIEDDYIMFRILMNDYISSQSSIGVIFLGCRDRLYNIFYFQNYQRLNGRGSLLSKGTSKDIMDITAGSALDRRSRMICPFINRSARKAFA